MVGLIERVLGVSKRGFYRRYLARAFLFAFLPCFRSGGLLRRRGGERDDAPHPDADGLWWALRSRCLPTS